jgi:FtsZ-binding cell division protein ZapB
LIHNIQDDLEKEINSLHILINTMKLDIEELKEANNDSRRKDNRIGLQVEELGKNLRKLDDRMQSSN